VNNTCCFTGHRPSKFSFKYDEENPDCKKLKQLLKESVEEAINKGCRHFISGMALGVDTWAAEIVLELKKMYPDIILEAAIPCKGQDSKWIKESRERYKKILDKADVITQVTNQTFAENPACMLVRNVYMINSSSLLIAVFDLSKGGTKHAFDYAKQLGINISRINPHDMTREWIEEKPKQLGGTLECSSVGDPRFSAMYAYVEVFGVKRFIEDHYQLSKRFGDDHPPKNKWQAKGKKPTHFVVNGKEYDTKYLSMWYKLLWCKYLDQNPELVAYAKNYDDFTDVFRGQSMNCQADVIKQYVKEGRKSIITECREFIDLIKCNG
jgi:uncharacterized phage-like protein YoqJ